MQQGWQHMKSSDRNEKHPNRQRLLQTTGEQSKEENKLEAVCHILTDIQRMWVAEKQAAYCWSLRLWDIEYADGVDVQNPSSVTFDDVRL